MSQGHATLHQRGSSDEITPESIGADPFQTHRLGLIETMPRTGLVNVGYPAGSGYIMSGRLGQPLRAGQEYTKMGMLAWSGLTGVTTTHWYFALIRAATLEIIRTSADQINAPWVSWDRKELSFLTPYTPAADEEAYIGFCGTGSPWNGTEFQGRSVGNTVSFLTDPPRLGGVHIWEQFTTPPATGTVVPEAHGAWTAAPYGYIA